jgi:hypothetical protein
VTTEPDSSGAQTVCASAYRVAVSIVARIDGLIACSVVHRTDAGS